MYVKHDFALFEFYLSFLAKSMEMVKSNASFRKGGIFIDLPVVHSWTHSHMKCSCVMSDSCLDLCCCWRLDKGEGDYPIPCSLSRPPVLAP